MYKKIKFEHRIVMIGFGTVGQATIPLLFNHLDIQPHQIQIITKDDPGNAIVERYGISLILNVITKENYLEVLAANLKPKDVLLNLSVGISSVELIKYCQQNEVLYLDLCTEPWAGFYDNENLAPKQRTNYALREAVLKLKNGPSTTALVTHGANPGLVSHFVKQALINIAKDSGQELHAPTSSQEWASLAKSLNIKAIHIAENDTQNILRYRQAQEFINTWSVGGFIGEGLQPAELGWGTHERHWPEDAEGYDYGEKCSIYLNRPGASVKVRTWTPSRGPFHGFLITHSEAISIADYLSYKENNRVIYRPTVHYAYQPCPLARLSLLELAGNEWQIQSKHQIIIDEIVDGSDELGVLLMGHQRGAYWFGSTLSIQEVRKIADYNNATTLQVVAGTIAGLLWVIEHPKAGLVEPEDIDFQYVLTIAKDYLGQLSGHYTDWTPLTNRERLFTEEVDHSDPWQFKNIRVT